MSDTAAATRVDFEALRRDLERVELALAGREELSEERRTEILRARARLVAGARAMAESDEVEALAFRVGGERYAVPLEELTMVLPSYGVSPLAGAPRWLLGAIAARGRLVPVLDLRQILRLEGGGMSDLGSVVVIESEDDVLGVAVESLEGHVKVPRARLEPGQGQGAFRYVTADRVAVLDPEALAQAAGALG